MEVNILEKAERARVTEVISAKENDTHGTSFLKIVLASLQYSLA